MEEKIAVKGSLHSHGCWTDYRNPPEQKIFPFDLETLASFCIDNGRDFQAISDIMAAPDKRSESRYSELLETADPKNKNYDLENGSKESTIHFKDGRKLVIPKTQEILTDKPFKHILAVGLEKGVYGGRNYKEILMEIRDAGGYSIIAHPFMCDAWTEQELLSLYDNGLISAIEWNGGLTLPSLASFLKKEVPSKIGNKKALKMEGKIQLIANDDAHSKDEIIKGAYTTYFLRDRKDPLTDLICEAILNGNFERHEKYSPFLSPFKHLKHANYSRKLFGENGLPEA